MDTPRSLAGRYRLISRISADGGGETWRAHDEELGRRVAIWFVPVAAVEDPAVRQRIVTEAQAAALITHPNVASVYDSGETQQADGPPELYVVTELVDGDSLADRLQQEPLNWRVAVEICAETAAGLSAGHARGLIHGSVDPTNIVITLAGAKLTGLGSGMMTGEQPDGRPAEPAADVFALGLVLYQALGGSPSSTAEERSAWLAAQVTPHSEGEPAAVPENVIAICRACLSELPSDRPLSVDIARKLARTVRRKVAAVESRPGDTSPTVVLRPAKLKGKTGQVPVVGATGEAGQVPVVGATGEAGQVPVVGATGKASGHDDTVLMGMVPAARRPVAAHPDDTVLMGMVPAARRPAAGADDTVLMGAVPAPDQAPPVGSGRTAYRQSPGTKATWANLRRSPVARVASAVLVVVMLVSCGALVFREDPDEPGASGGAMASPEGPHAEAPTSLGPASDGASSPQPGMSVAPSLSPSVTPKPSRSPKPSPTVRKSCAAGFAIGSWFGGATARLSITNTGQADVNGWTMTFKLADGLTLDGKGWNGTWTQSGATVTVKNVSSNAVLPVGRPVTDVGASLRGKVPKNEPAASGFALNGVACQAG